MKIKDFFTLLLLAKSLNAYSKHPIEILNGFLIAYGYLMKYPSDYSIVSAPSLCACKSQCTALNTSCVTVSMFKNENGTVECRISQKVVHEIYFTNVEGGFTFAKVSSFQHYLGKDGMFYDIIRQGTAWSQMESSCKSKYKTGRSLMLKYMDQIESSVNYFATVFPNSELYLNLNLTYDVTLSGSIWGDGTLLANTESGKYVPIVQGTYKQTFEFQLMSQTPWQFVGLATSRKTWVACQLNPFNFD